LFNDSDSGNHPNSDDGIDPNGADPCSGGDGSDPDDKGPRKDKGKAKATSPEYIVDTPAPSSVDGSLHDDLEKAKLNSLRETTDLAYTAGESSKQGAYRESMLHIEEKNLRMLEEKNQRMLEEKNQAMLDEYIESKKARLEAVRAFNDIIDELDKKGAFMHPSDKESLLNQSIKLRNLVEHYSNHAQTLKDVLSIDSSEEEFSEDNNSEEYESENYSDEEPRPSKRPKN